MTSAAGHSLTQVASAVWVDRPIGFRAWERTVPVGEGDDLWRSTADEVLRWGVKTRSGFTLDSTASVAVGDKPTITAHPLGLTILEPVEVVEVVRSADRVGFAYRTLPGHPVSGEEAFVISRDGDEVSLTIRSLTCASHQPLWRAAYPLLLVAQHVARRRYLRALRAAQP